MSTCKPLDEQCKAGCVSYSRDNALLDLTSCVKSTCMWDVVLDTLAGVLPNGTSTDVAAIDEPVDKNLGSCSIWQYVGCAGAIAEAVATCGTSGDFYTCVGAILGTQSACYICFCDDIGGC